MRKQTTFAAAVLSCACAAVACDFTHESAGGENGKHANMLGDGGYTTVNRTGAGRRNITFLSQLTLPQMGGGAGSSLWGWVDPLTNREYAIMGRSTGTSFVDVTNPLQPKLVANLATATTSSSWREPKVIGNHAYIGVDGVNHGIQSVDLTQLRNYNGTTLTLASTATTPVQRAHTLGINSMNGYANVSPDGNKYVYVAGGGTGLGVRVLNVNNPLAPTLVNSFNVDGYTHEMQVVTYNGPDTAHQGKEIAFAYNEDTLTIVDVTNKNAMTQMARLTQPNRGYVHQGWLTPDQKYIVSNDELDERNNLTGGKTRTHFWDVSNLDVPVYRGFYDHATAAVDHNLYIVGDMVFQSNYTTGLRVFKLGDLTNTNGQDNLIPVAEFDTYSPNNGNSFNGAWNNYPFFPSGNIAISDINGGLIMVKLGEGQGGPISPTNQAENLASQLSLINTAAFNASRGNVPEPAALSLLVPAAAMLIRRKR